jgi:hypothetical protein
VAIDLMSDLEEYRTQVIGDVIDMAIDMLNKNDAWTEQTLRTNKSHTPPKNTEK